MPVRAQVLGTLIWTLARSLLVAACHVWIGVELEGDEIREHGQIRWGGEGRGTLDPRRDLTHVSPEHQRVTGLITGGLSGRRILPVIGNGDLGCFELPCQGP